MIMILFFFSLGFASKVLPPNQTSLFPQKNANNNNNNNTTIFFFFL
jgi:hypothetical protein